MQYKKDNATHNFWEKWREETHSKGRGECHCSKNEHYEPLPPGEVNAGQRMLLLKNPGLRPRRNTGPCGATQQG